MHQIKGLWNGETTVLWVNVPLSVVSDPAAGASQREAGVPAIRPRLALDLVHPGE